MDYVALNLWPTAVETLLLLKPDIYAKGPDYQDQTTDLTGQIRDEEEAIRSVGGELFITSGQVFSSSRLLNQSLSGYTDEQIEYFRSFALKHPADEVISWLKLHTLRILVIGRQSSTVFLLLSIGMVTKDPTVAVNIF